jgi:hypothetical protein
MHPASTRAILDMSANGPLSRATRPIPMVVLSLSSVFPATWRCAGYVEPGADECGTVLRQLSRDDRVMGWMLIPVGTLDARDYARMLDLAIAVLDDQGSGPPWTLITRALNDALRGTVAIFESDQRPALGTANVLAWTPDEIGVIGIDARTRELRPAHPLALIYATGESAPLTVNDVVDESTWRQVPTTKPHGTSSTAAFDTSRFRCAPLREPSGPSSSAAPARTSANVTESSPAASSPYSHASTAT